MGEQWAVKHRPVRWFDFAGQRPAIWTLFQTILRDDPPPAILLYGEAGCGKTSTARTIAKSLNCESEVRTAREWPCGKCSSCLAVASGSSIDVEEIDAASNGSVALIRELRQRAGQYSASRYKVFILDEAHQMSAEAFDALLKTLEEPLEQVVFILVTTRLRKIPRTIQTRCGKFRFDPLSVPVIRARLEHIAQAEGYSPPPGLLSAIAESAEGGMRDAIMAMDLAASAGITSVTMWRELTGVTDFAPALLAAAASADYGVLFAALDEAVAGDPGRVTSQLVLCLTDMLVLTVPGGEISRDGEAAESRRALAARLGPARILAGLQVLWELPRVATGNPRADLSLAVSMISRRWAPPAAFAGPIVPGESGQDALSRLRGVLGAPSDQPGAV